MSINNHLFYGLLFILIVHSSRYLCDAKDPISISQISPKSSTIDNFQNNPNADSSKLVAVDDDPNENVLIIKGNNIESSSLPEIIMENEAIIEDSNQNMNKILTTISESDPIEIITHDRVERSASPILNDISSKNINGLNSFNDYNTADVSVDDTNSASDGHYYNLIKPTSTSVNRQYDEIGEITHNNNNNNNHSNNRFGKELSLDSFLSKGGPVRPLKSDGPLNQQQQQQLQLLINPTSVTSMMGLPIATNNHHDQSSSAATAGSIGARQQNPNPDIQDIITGIVKLLNGNVNVHANTQPTSRRPYTTRINNRGPPRISESQPIPPTSNDGYGDDQLSLSNRPQHHQHAPPPYPFDRPDVPIRPFLQGVPIPEQIVPSMQQNYRPGFISQNRPPWQRPRPRPPITTNRRPIPPYKPIPTLPEYQMTQQQQQPQQPQQPQQQSFNQLQQQSQQPQLHQLPYHHQQNIDDIEDNLQQMITTTESDTITINETQLIEHNNATDDYINVNFDESADDSTDLDELLMLEEEAAEIPVKKDELALKKKDKMSEHKNKLSNSNNNNNNNNNNINISATSTLTPTTIIQSTSEINTLQYISSTMTTITSHPILLNPSENFETSKLESSIIDDDADIHMFNSQTIDTPQLVQTTTSSSPSSSSSSLSTSTPLEMSSEIPSIRDSVSSTTTLSPFIKTTSTLSSTSILSTASTLPTQNLPYHPRPGIVLDDPEFKPGGGARPSPAINRLPPLGGLPSGAAAPPPYHAQRPQQIQPTRQQLPPGYGEIFDVTLSAIQGPGSGSGGQQTIRIKPYQNVGNTGSGYGGGGGGIYGQTGDDDIIVSPAGDDGFVSIDGKRTYINLFGESTDIETPFKQQPSSASINPSKTIGPQSVQQTKDVQNIPTGITGTGYAIVETEIPPNAGQKHSAVQSTTGNNQPSPLPTQSVHRPPSQPHFRPRPQQQQPPVRIDTCIVGDDSTCDQTQNEKCKTESGVSSCHCRPGFGRRIHREPCRKVVSFLMSLRVDKIYDRRIQWDSQLADENSEPYGTLSYEASRAIDSAMSMTPFSDEFMNAHVNKIYNGDASQGAAGVFVNVTLQLEENGDTIRPTVKSDIQKHLLGVIHRRNNNIGNSVLYVDSPQGSISNLQDLDECTTDGGEDLNDCHPQAVCTNVWGSYRCECEIGYRDPWYDQPQRAGRECHTCPETYCNNRGTCSYDENGSQQICTCFGSYYGQQCEIDGEVLGVAIGASIAAVIIIVLTLICLVMWSRRWHREQKNSMGSPVFGYMNTAALQVKTPVGGVGGGLSLGGPTAPQPYQVTLEDRMRWAQIADVMSQSNHYAAEPTSPSTRPSSAMFGYPNLQLLGNAGGNNGGGGGGGNLSMMGTLPMQQHHHSSSGTLPPVPMPRLGLRSNGIRQLENSSSSEEEDRADLLGRNFQVPRPKSRSTNGSIANQSVIYYDVDYEPSGGGGHDLYGGTQTTTLSNQMPGPQGIPMSTYTSGRAPSMYYVK